MAAAAAGLVGFGVHHHLTNAGVRPHRATLLAGTVSVAVFVIAALFVLTGPSPLWIGLLVGATAGLAVARSELG